jgi:hypothetical protein
VRRIAGVIGLVYAALVVAMNVTALNARPSTLLYVLAAVLAPIAVLTGDHRARRGGETVADAVAQAGLGVLFGIWAQPASSGLVALLAMAAGLWSAFRSPHHRGYAAVALLVGSGTGLGLLALTIAQ